MQREDYLRKLDEIREIPTLPIILARINRMLQDRDTPAGNLSQVIESDQAITAKILKLVNSAFYGVRRQISNIPHALMMLGFNNVRNALISVSVFKAFPAGPGKGFDGKDLWKHAVAVAVISKYLAGETCLFAPEDSFVAGLLHDIGKIIIAQYFPESFDQILTSVREEGLSFYQAEKKRFPFDHAQIGGHFAQKWHFPQGLAEAIEHHHSLNKEGVDLSLRLTVHFADQIANHGSAEVASELRAASLEILKVLDLHLERVGEWLPSASAEIDSACQFFLQEDKDE